tara:strand:- start:58 stop:1926 length:1869 start_codon:yes stop_codon:yes gene_type:complete
MSIATGGIDSQIQDKMDTYRSNPQALQKAVGVTKQTVDIMALQKLISEKKEKAKALMAEAEQNPKTIAEQRQEEAIAQIKSEMGGTLNERAKQTAGTLNNKAAMQKKNMGRMAQNASKPKMGGGAGLAGLMGGNRRPPMPPRGGPQAAGLPNARMMQAVQGGPVRRMAGGGIVGFSNGESVKKRTLTEAQKEALTAKFGGAASRYINQIEAGTLGPLSTGLQTRNEIAEILGDADAVVETPTGGIDPLGLMRPKLGQDTGTSVETVPEDKTGIAAVPFSDPYAGNSVADPKTGGIAQKLNKDTTVPTTVVEQKSGLPPTTTTAGTVGMSKNVMGTVNDISSDIAFDKGVTRSDANLRRDETNKSYEDMQAQLAAFDAENYGENDDIYSFLIGTGGTGSIGAAARGGKQAMDREIRNKRNRLLKSFELETDKMGADREIGIAGQELGKVFVQEAAANERNIRTNTTNMTMKEMTVAQADADRVSIENRAELLSADRALDREVSVMQVDNQTMELQQRAALDIMNIVSATRDALTLKEETNGSEAGDLAEAIKAYEDADTVKEKKAADEDLARIRAKIALIVDSAMNKQREGSDYNMLEMETEAQRVFIKSLQKPTGGKILSVR